ncbi:WecB/TagA/CpsF family glycosyltransferase [Pseudanabaena yagii]|uniref:WecB/TagA/CpsF family glycosyltransferase n=1 Tax=Pseudanabaena yagii GIHE-NHR1 TaxID=2722753 RepID=A0ABX1LWK2_9CYAN|nr:WecB/TagA/CpsF family glycosyltransferase [Pseudanabaena yagii]NMF60573.1 WecB/TagA/CpsF family glycosyltransferase [Pseudanabaena yagii GIHE-NHR1]
MHKDAIPSQNLIVTPVSILSFDEQINLMIDWANKSLSKMVCVANVHMLVEAWQNSPFADVLKDADLVTPDGMPLVWMMKMLGHQKAQRVAGMDIFQAVCKQAQTNQISIFLLGSETYVLDKISQRLQTEFPDLKVAGTESPPFRPLSNTADMDMVQIVNASGAKILFVALGCPKQELWMAQHRDKIQAVMIGVGGVFPVYAGVLKETPKFMQVSGLEWVFRLSQEPRRLWKRYATTIPIFIWLMIKQVVYSSINQQKRNTLN